MRVVLPLAVGVICFVLPVVTSADDKQNCRDSNDHDLRIKVCSSMIQRDPTDASAYHSRGVAYQLKGDFASAMSDYNKAIELKPDYAPAYESRGRAFASKGDYTSAVADVTKAGELTPKPAPRPKANKPANAKAKVVAKRVVRPQPNNTEQLPSEWPDWAPR
jgi:tetratricopeptide (TPR) repeat protein